MGGSPALSVQRPAFSVLRLGLLATPHCRGTASLPFAGGALLSASMRRRQLVLELANG
jgi:hypothetical protein